MASNKKQIYVYIYIYQGGEEEEGQEEEHLGRLVEASRYGVPGQASHARRREEEEEHRPEQRGQPVATGEPLIQRHEQHQVMRQPKRKEAHRTLHPPHLRRRPRPDQVTDHRELARRVRHRRQEPLPLGEPLSIYLHVQSQHRSTEHKPKSQVTGMGRCQKW